MQWMKARQLKCKACCYAGFLFVWEFHLQPAVHCADGKLRQAGTYSTAREARLQTQARTSKAERACQDRLEYSRREYKSARQEGGGGGGRVLAILDLRFRIDN